MNESFWRLDLLIDENCLFFFLVGEDDLFFLEGNLNEDCKFFILLDIKFKIKDNGDLVLLSFSNVILF